LLRWAFLLVFSIQHKFRIFEHIQFYKTVNTQDAMEDLAQQSRTTQYSHSLLKFKVYYKTPCFLGIMRIFAVDQKIIFDK